MMFIPAHIMVTKATKDQVRIMSMFRREAEAYNFEDINKYMSDVFSKSEEAWDI